MSLSQAATPAGIGQNRTRGGLYNADAANASLKRSGHIEPRLSTGLTEAELGITSKAGLPALDTVSGTVILRGYAEDDIRVGSVTINIGGTNVPVLSAASAVTNSGPPADTSKTGLLTAAANVFYTDTVDLAGHRVEWAYVWNTQATPSATDTIGDAVLRVEAKNTGTPAAALTPDRTVTRAPYITGIDRGSNSWVSGRSVQGWYGFARAETITVRGFNFLGGASSLTVPVTSGSGAVTATPAADTDTSRPGHTASFTVPTTAKSGRLAFKAGAIDSVNAIAAARTIRPWNEEASVAEGSDLWDDQVSAHIWQSGDTTGASNPDSGYIGTDTNYPLESPAVTIRPDSGALVGIVSTDTERGWVYSNDNTGRAIANNGLDAGLSYLFNWYDPVVEGDIHYNLTAATGTAGAQYSVYNVQGQWGTNTGWYDYGGIYIKVPTGGGTTGIHDASYDGNHYLVEKTHYDKVTDQFANPHIVTFLDTAVATAANQMRIHVSYHDVKDGSIKYRHFQANETAYNTEANATKGWINLDGGEDGEDSNAVTDYNVDTAANPVSSHHVATYIRVPPKADGWVEVGDKIVTFANTSAATGGTVWDIFAKESGYYKWKNNNEKTIGQMVDAYTTVIFSITHITDSDTRVVNYGSRPASRHNVGFYNAIDVTSQGYPVVVYKDQTAGTLKLARSNSKTPTTAANWTVQDVFPAGDPNGTNVGDYVSFRIDPKAGADLDRIHIATVRGANLVYITGTRNTTTGVYTFTPSLVVDSPGAVGKWADLSLDKDGVPYITYRLSRGARMVFPDTSRFAKTLHDSNNKVITGWEAMYVSARYQVDDHRLSVENFPTRQFSARAAGTKDWIAAVGYIGRNPASTVDNDRLQRFRIAYYVKY
jgi:hypothetical protein